eukprot:1844693-Heterocapsa_arctica.AAC.1
MSAIDSILNEVMGPVLAGQELIEDSSTSTVQAGRSAMTARIRRLAATNPSLKAANAELLRLTGQDASFNPPSR